MLTDSQRQPYAADELAVLDADRLVGACAWRYAGGGTERCAVIVGQVDPRERRRGIGGRLLDLALDDARAAVKVQTESLCAGADALYRSRGLTCAFAEDVMTCPLAGWAPAAATGPMWFAPSGANRSPKGSSPSTRPRSATGLAFPGWSSAEWIGWLSGEESFRADWTLLGSLAGADVGFIAAADGGWIA